ncbi:MAG: hypothetical protein A3I07_00325 [Candidatus Doudnabacteria bacterium RIFCSPLOWO2_02_FULL_42_9]|uniref:Uncharacterized protein n=1 Tax=Candidatus Doudnabacteria bacterium RIFCSPHIGHO2_01_FULL_41_86 TaxID=1817821 RepID=A0A1F5N9Z9_9BACT|nr:MAG: hypothetical protein A2717_02525 [Candidatus Doudnabacteria bacterium RIFCSPHIGHO2_01_FULL_41_86]OGE75474.1 MAG: hypothetical protein A3K07_00855 [Candidatus Doudnabacteria bacterium RIFCSPHIGHO2_01_43_10]OGF00863.1 MAG: hypothetical protein A3I07_00325 [Candidatus Doudnabacteria bacterium RIFCSPLOWO2_02_FULL_42_9]
MMITRVQRRTQEWPQGRIFKATLRHLLDLQRSTSRDLTIERTIAQDANTQMHASDDDMHGFSAHVVAKGAYESDYGYPRVMEQDETTRAIAIHKSGSVEAATRLRRLETERLVGTYLNGFSLGTDLGYPDLGDNWFLHFADSTGTYLVSVDEVRGVVKTGF